MSDLRYFADTMLQLIERERRLQQISDQAKAYEAACRAFRAASLPRGDQPAPEFTAATEGLNAVRIILRGETP